MAEQIRSFWSHLCSFFGAIFGMIAGGTLITIDRANAVGYTYEYNVTLSNGAVIDYKYGRAYAPYWKSDSQQCSKPCKEYTPNGCDNVKFNRYYVTFKGCADGYYSSGIVNNQRMITTLVGHTTSSGGVQITSGGLYDQGACQFVKACGGSAQYMVCDRGLYTAVNGDRLYQNAGVYEQTDGLCIKCPDYDTVYNDYTSKSINGTGNITFSTAISTCFMSKDTGRSDAIEHDGNATGTFVWTSDCHYTADSTGGTTGGGITVDMSTNGVFNNLKDIFENELDLDMQYVQLETKLMGDGLDIDSVGAMSLIMAIEEEYGIKIDDEEASTVFASGTFGDLVRLIQEKVG